MEEKRYNVIDATLQGVFTEIIRISDSEKKKYNESLQQVLDSIVMNMKNDEVFKFLYRTREYSGSSYENLKISKPNEFDINLIFGWPGNSCQVVYDPNQPGFVKLKVNLNDPALQRKLTNLTSIEKIFSKWIDKNGYFLRHLFKSWMQGIVDKALRNISIEDTEIKRSECGAGFTLKVSQQLKQLEYSVDVVPAFLLSINDWPKLPVRQLHGKITCKEWTVVPKEPRSESEPVYWRTSFYQQERELMKNRFTMKAIIKLIKLLRDQQVWSNDLHSYAIKTIFLWECEVTSIDTWQKGLGNMFMKMLQKLSDCLSDGKITYYWDPKLDLIEKMKCGTKKNIRDRIAAIMKDIDSNLHNPIIIKTYFGCTPERTQQSQNEVSNVRDISLLDLDNDESEFHSHLMSHFNVQRDSESETSTETEKITVDVQCTCKLKNECASEIEDSTSTVELLKMILKGQQESKQLILNMSEQLTKISEEVILLRNEKDVSKRNSMATTNNPLSNDNNISSLRNSISHSSSDQYFSTPNQKNYSSILNSSAANSPLPTGVTNPKDSMFSELLSFQADPNSSSNSSSHEEPNLLD